jgi:membrane-associated protein
VQNWILALAASPLVYLGMYLFAAIDGFFPPIPSESLAIALAALSASTGQPNLALIILSAATGAFTGDQIAYTIGKRLDVRRIPFMGGPRWQKALDWAGRSLELRGGIGHPRCTLHPGRAGRREHDRRCGGLPTAPVRGV